MHEPKLVFIDRAQQKPRVRGLAVVHDTRSNYTQFKGRCFTVTL